MPGFAAFTVFELLSENQQGVDLTPPSSPFSTQIRVKGHDNNMVTDDQYCQIWEPAIQKREKEAL